MKPLHEQNKSFQPIHDHVPQQPEEEARGYGIDHYIQQIHETAENSARTTPAAVMSSF